MASLRLFVALDLPPEARRALDQALRAAAIARERVKAVRPEALHLTLRFLGDVPEEDLEALSEALREIAAATAPFSLEVAGAGTFGAPRRPRVLYAALADEPALPVLADRVERAVLACGLPPADKPFAAHLTLARARDRGGDRSLASAAKALADLRLEPFRLEELVLYESELRPDGPRYRALLRAPLRGEGGAKDAHPP